MVKHTRGGLAVLHLLATLQTAIAQSDAINGSTSGFQYVDQLIGTDNGGNVFAGATLPYGMVKAVPDVSGQNTCGFSTDGTNVTGFSHMHDSGTGGNPSMGQFPLMPQVSCPGDDLQNCQFGSKTTRAVNYVNSSVVASPGYFSLGLVNGIEAEMTSTAHTALYHFKFPDSNSSDPLSPLMLLDLTDLNDSRQNATVEVDPETGRIKGNGTFLPSFGSGSYIAHFCADFTGASVRDTGIWVNNRGGTDPKSLFVTRGINAFYIEAGGFVRFNKPTNNNTLTARVGMSLISADKACENAENEIADFDFAKVKQDAEDAWKAKLGAVSVVQGSASDDMLRTYWSGLYRTMISPQDYTGENPLWMSSEPYFDSFYCLWDAFRAQHPLLTITDPDAQSRMVRSLIDTYSHLGWLPDCRMSLSKGFTQGGSNADVVLVDAYVKNLTGIDWSLAYEAIKNDAENEPIDWSVEGRGGLQSWKKYGYIPYLDFDYLGFGTNSRSISRTLEYAYNDFTISILAKALGHTSDASLYLSRSGNWLNIYLANQTGNLPNGTSTGFTGFFQPRYQNGTFGYQDPTQCSSLDGFCSLTSNPQEVFESSVFEYQFYVPHDTQTLIETLGGTDEFVSRLDYLHESGLLDIGNEPSFITVFLYHYASLPALSVDRIHQYIPSSFNASTTGLPGNDDSGAMGSFAVFGMSGLFPVPGQSVYLISVPFLDSVSFKDSRTGNIATIRVGNPTGKEASGGVYIQSATLNGGNYTKSWIDHTFFLEGKELVLNVGTNRNSSWGTGADDIPPSPARGSAGTAGIFGVNAGKGNSTTHSARGFVSDIGLQRDAMGF